MKTPWIDPIVEEIRRHREEYAARFDFDLKEMFLDLKRLEQEDEGVYVSFSREEDLESLQHQHPRLRRGSSR
jgi:hypothetical protein